MLSNLDSSPASSEDLPQTSGIQTTLNKKPGFMARWRRIVKGLWIILFIITTIVTMVALPADYKLLQTVCNTKPCHLSYQPTVQQAIDLQNLGISLNSYALYNLTLEVANILIYFTLAWLVFWPKIEQPVPFLIGILFITIGPNTVFSALENDNTSPFQLSANILDYIAFIALFLVFYLFPDGRFVPKWTFKLMPGVALFFFVLYLLPYPDWLELTLQIIYGLLLVSLIVAQIFRYFWVSNANQRQQTKWVTFGLAFVIAADVINFLPFVFLPDIASNTIYGLVSRAIFTLILLILPVTIVIAVLQYRLWDIYPIINRTVVYILLSLSVIGIYILTVGILGAIFQTNGNFFISLVATALVAIGFHPAQAAVQQVVNRLMYGERDDPLRVLSRLGERLESSLTSDTILPSVVEITAHSVKSPYVAIELKEPLSDGTDADQFKMVAAYGTPTAQKFYFPLVYQNETVGQLVLAPRGPGEQYSAGDKRLLNNLARQAGVAAYAVQLTQDLQRSRERLVTSREEERRRLRRDLHDGLGPTLAALNLQAGMIRPLISSSPTSAQTMLDEWRTGLKTSIADIRRLVYELRPPALDELGLVGAIRGYIGKYQSSNDFAIEIIAPAPDRLVPLPAAVEVAAYRIVQEAITNVLKHAKATKCQITFQFARDLTIIIEDNGIGIGEGAGKGVGMVSMRERAEELSGSWNIENLASGGTRVMARLPLPED